MSIESSDIVILLLIGVCVGQHIWLRKQDRVIDEADAVLKKMGPAFRETLNDWAADRDTVLKASQAADVISDLWDRIGKAEGRLIFPEDTPREVVADIQARAALAGPRCAAIFATEGRCAAIIRERSKP